MAATKERTIEAGKRRANTLPGTSGQVWIRVYRKSGATATCDFYTITASD